MNNALIIIDAQNDFVTGVLGTPEAVEAVPHILKRIYRANENGGIIYFTKDSHHPKNHPYTQEWKRLPIPHCLLGTLGECIVCDLIAEAEPNNTTVLTKDTFGIDDWKYVAPDLSEADKITLCGFCTDICVITNALLLKTAFPETTIEVVAKACAGTTPEMHRKALDVMKSCQIDIV